MFGMGADIGIDLGTAYVLVYVKNKGIVIKEPSVIAVKGINNEVIAVGEEAKAMIGRTPQNIRTIRPLREGVISDLAATEHMLKYFIDKAIGSRLVKPRIGVCIPCEITEVEKRAVQNAATGAGARYVDTIEEPVAAAIGAGLDIAKPMGNMIVDIGGGTTDIAVISLGGPVVRKSIKVAGDNMDQAIISYMKKEHNLLIGERTAENIKIEIGGAIDREEVMSMRVSGRNLLKGLPAAVEINSKEIRLALEDNVVAIVQTVKEVLEETPPELAADISDNGIILTGGSALLYGLDQVIEKQTGIRTQVAENPLTCVAEGTGTWVDYIYAKKAKVREY